MRLTVLDGCGAWPAAGQACSGYLLEQDGFRLLVDPGYAIVPRLLELIDAAEVDAVLVSHGHPDHCADLYPLLRARVLTGDAGPRGRALRRGRAALHRGLRPDGHHGSLHADGIAALATVTIRASQHRMAEYAPAVQELDARFGPLAVDARAAAPAAAGRLESVRPWSWRSPFGRWRPASATPWQRRCTGAATAVAVSATRG